VEPTLMCFCPDDVPEFSTTTRPKARKPHRCAECHRSVEPGEVYVRAVQKWEGEVSATVFCRDCYAWAMALCQAQRIVCECSGWPLGDLWDEIREFSSEHLGYDPSRDPEDEKDFLPGTPDPELAGFELRVDDGYGY
jgi:hypothetical protein